MISNKQLFFVSGRISLQALRCFHKPTTSLFVSLLVFQQLRSILLCKDAFQADLWYKLAFSSPFFYFNDLASILSFRRHCDVVLFTHHLVLSRSCSFPCLSIQPERCVYHSSFNRSLIQVLSFCQVHVLFLPCSTGVLPEFFLSHLVVTGVVLNPILSIKLLIHVFATFKLS